MMSHETPANGSKRLSVRRRPPRPGSFIAARQKRRKALGARSIATRESHPTQSSRRIWGPCHARVLNVWRPDCRNQSWSGQLEKAIRTCTPIPERPRMRRPRNVCGGHELPTTRILSGFFVLAMGLQPGGKSQEHRHRIAAAFLERSGLERVEQTLDLRGRNELV